MQEVNNIEYLYLVQFPNNDIDVLYQWYKVYIPRNVIIVIQYQIELLVECL